MMIGGVTVLRAAPNVPLYVDERIMGSTGSSSRRQPLDEDPHLARVFAGCRTRPSYRASPARRMPELPEVEAARRVAERLARGRRIVDVWCADDPIVFERIPAARWSPRAARPARGAVSAMATPLVRAGPAAVPCIHFG